MDACVTDSQVLKFHFKVLVRALKHILEIKRKDSSTFDLNFRAPPTTKKNGHRCFYLKQVLAVERSDLKKKKIFSVLVMTFSVAQK